MTIGVGLVGFGLAGRVIHTPLIEASGLRIAAVVTSQADAVRERLPNAKACADFGDLLAQPGVDLVVIASPNVFHFEQAKAALEAGKHVVVDKPVTPTADETRQLDSLARARALVASAFHNRRWDADTLTIAKLLHGGAVGAPYRFRTSWNRRRGVVRTAWRDTPGPGAGVLYDLGAHMIDQALQLFGRPQWIQADLFRQSDDKGEPDDGFELLLGQGRLRMSLAACSFSSAPARTYQLDGEVATFSKTGFDLQEAHLKAGADPRSADFGAEPEWAWGEIVRLKGAAEAVPSEPGRWTAYYDGVRRAIETHVPPPVTLAQAADVIAIIEAAFESARTGRRVELDTDRRRLENALRASAPSAWRDAALAALEDPELRLSVRSSGARTGEALRIYKLRLDNARRTGLKEHGLAEFVEALGRLGPESSTETLAFMGPTAFVAALWDDAGALIGCVTVERDPAEEQRRLAWFVENFR